MGLFFHLSLSVICFLHRAVGFIHFKEYSGYSARANVTQGESKLVLDIFNFSHDYEFFTSYASVKRSFRARTFYCMFYFYTLSVGLFFFTAA